MGNYTMFQMFENPMRGRQARNFTTNVLKILVLKSSSEQIFSRKLPLGAPDESYADALSHRRSRQRYKIFLPKPAAQNGTAHRGLTHYINRFGHSKVFVITVLILIFKVSIKKALKEKSFPLPKSHLGCFLLVFTG